MYIFQESDDDDDDSDVDVAEDDVASDGFDFSDAEWIINLPLSTGQRKLYDDYLSSASSRKALDSLDAESIAKVRIDDWLDQKCNEFNNGFIFRFYIP